jgi:hypothetical protein
MVNLETQEILDTRNKIKTNKAKHITQNTKKMNKTDPTKKEGAFRCPRGISSFCFL